jgi:hypoxanthine phosphoribosyltransferase
VQKKELADVLRRIDEIRFDEDFDLVVAVLNGGREPARLVAEKLGLPVAGLRVNFRDEKHRPRRAAPVLLAPPDFDLRGRRVLVVDDRSRTGATLALAREVLGDAAVVRTLAVNGKADYFLFDEPCFVFPWAPGGPGPNLRGDS